MTFNQDWKTTKFKELSPTWKDLSIRFSKLANTQWNQRETDSGLTPNSKGPWAALVHREACWPQIHLKTMLKQETTPQEDEKKMTSPKMLIWLLWLFIMFSWFLGPMPISHMFSIMDIFSSIKRKTPTVMGKIYMVNTRLWSFRFKGSSMLGTVKSY